MNAVFDRATGTVQADVRLANTSKDTLSAPMWLRVIALTSPLGTPAFVGADNQVAGSGALFDLSSFIPGGRLAPGERSNPRRLTVKFSDLKPFAPENYATSSTDFVLMQTKVFAGGKPRVQP
jgi:hypothetical protein